MNSDVLSAILLHLPLISISSILSVCKAVDKCMDGEWWRKKLILWRSSYNIQFRRMITQQSLSFSVFDLYTTTRIETLKRTIFELSVERTYKMLRYPWQVSRCVRLRRDASGILDRTCNPKLIAYCPFDVFDHDIFSNPGDVQEIKDHIQITKSDGIYITFEYVDEVVAIYHSSNGELGKLFKAFDKIEFGFNHCVERIIYNYFYGLIYGCKSRIGFWICEDRLTDEQLKDIVKKPFITDEEIVGVFSL